MRVDRASLLNSIGFEWKVKPRIEGWNEMYLRLAAYLSVHGNANVPRRYDQDPQLGEWVHRQRRDDKNNKIPPKHSSFLNHIGFDWSFVWYLDTCVHCSPLVFPNILRPWLPPEVIKPKVGNLHVFDGSRPHYVPPHTCAHDRIVVSGNLIHRTVQNDLNDGTRPQYSKVF